MSQSEAGSEIVLELAEEFLERYRNGERPGVEVLRDADCEVTLQRDGLPMADSVSLAAQLLGKLTSPAQAAVEAETRLIIQETLNSMDPIDREVLALKHFEQLSTAEIAEVLGLSKAGAGSCYLKAIKRLHEILEKTPGFRAL
jgi:RNA polymerase sigma-70 factor (ECF subfamily)